MKNYLLTTIAILSCIIGRAQNPTDISIAYASGGETVCKGDFIRILITAQPETLSYTYVVEEFVNNNWRTERVQTIDNGDPLEFLPISETRLYRVRANRSETKEFSVTALELSAGFDSVLKICKSDTKYDIFSALAGAPDAAGFWSGPEGNAFGEDHQPNFNPEFDQEGVYTYTVPGNGFCPEISSQLEIVVDTSDRCDTKTLADVDGDGILNAEDLDDDNDGILDSEEGAICTSADQLSPELPFFEDDFGKGGPTQSPWVVSNLQFNSGTPQDLNQDFLGEYNVATSTHLLDEENFNWTFAATDLIGNVDAGGDTDGRYLMINMNTLAFVNKPVLQISDLYLEAGITYHLEIAIANLGNRVNEIEPNLALQVINPENSDAILAEQRTGIIPRGTDNWIRYSVQFIPNVTVPAATFQIVNLVREYGLGNDIGIDSIRMYTLGCDTDGDGISNARDLDSDNDGISDTLEAGLDPELDANRDGVVDGEVDQNGVPLAVSGGLTPVDTNTNNIPDYLEDSFTLHINEINTYELGKVGIYFDSSNQQLVLENKNGDMLEKFSVFSIDGKRIVSVPAQSSHTMRIDMAGIPKGIYFISGIAYSTALRFIVR